MVNYDNTNITKVFADNLRRIMKAKGYTQLDIAQGIGISKATISDWLNEKKVPRMDNVASVAQYLHVSINDLVRTPEERKQVEVEHAREKIEQGYKEGNDIARAMGYPTFDYVDEVCNVINAYMKAPDAIQEAIKKLLDIK